MGVTRRYRRRPIRSLKRRTARSVRRTAGAFGLYRGTRNVAATRAVARRLMGRPMRALNPFPNSRLVRHKYVDSCIIPAGSASGLASVYQFKANDMYDPDYTSVGHQPLFRDEMVAQYSVYTVLKSNIRVTFGQSNGQEVVFGLWLDDDTSFPSDVNTVSEQHSTTCRRLDRQAAGNPLILKGWYDAAKWQKTTRSAVLADDMQRVNAGGSPDATLRKYWTIYACPLMGSVTLTPINVRVEIVYYTLWREPKDHTGS